MSAPAGPHAVPATLLACARCGRRFLLVPGPEVAAPSRCACGAALTPASLPSGVHGLKHHRGAGTSPPPHRSDPSSHPRAPDQETDLGYGASHGYTPGHGGPTGPGDAPAPAHATPGSSSERAEDVEKQTDGEG
ncbi:hypothetical protein [Sorangium sp. So ce1000]|uniref:hypothetical protein n=1 Tax=Sorangium sp. So ce1000 TaxID=3133325 RepID=UPI003F5E29E9